MEGEEDRVESPQSTQVSGNDAALKVLDRVISSMNGSVRQGQTTMVEAISDAITHRSHLMVQAGTGTGKSVGYLVSLLTDCALNGTRGLVSTATLALQRQILMKDAPRVVDAVAEETGVRLKVSVLKGWSNYLCLSRTHGGYPQEGMLFDFEPQTDKDSADSSTTDMGRDVLRVRQWAKETSTGDRDDLQPGVSEKVWRHVSVSKRECLGKSCAFIDECFAQLARDEAHESDVIVTNHSLFGISTTSDTDLFPGIDAVVIDEAHELPERVREQSGVEISQSSVMRTARVLRTHAKISVASLEDAAVILGGALSPLDEGLLIRRSDVLADAMVAVDAAARQAMTELKETNVDQAAKLLARAALDELIGVLDAWSRDPADVITWVTRPDEGIVRLNMAPLDVASALARRGFADRPAILTSATLKLGDSFDASARECGFLITGEQWDGIDVGSPFDPGKQAILYVAAHLPQPGQYGPSAQSLDELVELVQASGGGALVLFSSWKGAEAGVEVLRERTDYTVLFQGEETLSTLIEQFRQDEDSCLVGTLSLWQGVDVPGHSCRLVIMDRIPFPHPADPVAKARSIDAQKRGMNGFVTVSLTHAALLMAQGAGRLLRSISDRGVVAVLDPRVTTKNYGRFIRSSMPQMWFTDSLSTAKGALKRLNDTHHQSR